MNFWSVDTFREAGLEAKWGKTRKGTPCILLKDPNGRLPHQREKWWILDKGMAKLMQDEGIIEGFNNATILGDMFSI